MTGKKQTHDKDRLRDRSDIGAVEFPIEKLMEFRDANASCVHIEAAMDADRGLTDTGKNAPEVTPDCSGARGKADVHQAWSEIRFLARTNCLNRTSTLFDKTRSGRGDPSSFNQ